MRKFYKMPLTLKIFLIDLGALFIKISKTTEVELSSEIKAKIADKAIFIKYQAFSPNYRIKEIGKFLQTGNKIIHS